MYAAILVIIILVTTPQEICCRRRITTREDAIDCHVKKCDYYADFFNCRCEDSNWREADPECISTKNLCDAHQDCENNSDESECFCLPGQFQCGSDLGGEVERFNHQYNCINDELVGDGNNDCYDWQDELLTFCDTYFRCNGFLDCKDRSDERGCDCPPGWPNHCACNEPGSDLLCKNTGLDIGPICYPDEWRCDGQYHCMDGSDEDGCSCKNDEFTCECYWNNPKTCPSFGVGCIPMSSYLDMQEDCTDGSDEQEYFKRTHCAFCLDTIKTFNIEMAIQCFCLAVVRRLDFIEQCDKYSDCENNTCATVPALNCTDNAKCSENEVICTSGCDLSKAPQSCDTIFQCENGYIDIAHNFCDGKIDCPDGSDEIINQPGFKCSTAFGRCVLPQRNLHDDVPQCKNASDLCLDPSCYECLDGKLNISQTQLCDGVIDCFDLSDECLCEVQFHKPICQEIFVLNDPSKLKCGKMNLQCYDIESTTIEKAECKNHSFMNTSRNTKSSPQMPKYIHCESQNAYITTFTCDGRPKCRKFEDECFCEDAPVFCKDRCHDYYPLGDRYCDGIIDEAWKYINNSLCPEGFEEASCPHRYPCKAGNLVSIDIEQVCDGIKNCDDGSDEDSCLKNSVNTEERIFSSETEMIESIALRCAFWSMAVLVILGNCSVIFSTIRWLYTTNLSNCQKMNPILILNLSFSDLLMGFYLLLIGTKSVEYSGYYGKIDHEWRTSLQCSIIGSLALISSETSCFIMTILTAFRLYNVSNPFTARTAPILPWKLGIVVAWSLSIVLALLPLFKATGYYFVNDIWFSNQFTASEVWNKSEVMTFACRLATLSNQSIEGNGDGWESTQLFLNKYFPNYSPKGEFGYYGETSVCLPRLYGNYGDHAWMYSLMIVSFNFISFLFVVFSYIRIYWIASKRPIQTSKSDKQNAEMQKRIARLIATDFACWIPICVIAYMKMGGVEISKVVYIVTGGVLLPINSALNPLLYSSIVDEMFKKIISLKKSYAQEETYL